MRNLHLADLIQVSGGDTAMDIQTNVIDANNGALTTALGAMLLGELTPQTLADVLAAAQVSAITIGNFTITPHATSVPTPTAETSAV